jgi:hypothetical protein
MAKKNPPKHQHQSKNENRGKHPFIVSGQPIGKKNIKVISLGVRISPCYECQRAVHSENYKHQSFQYNQTCCNPGERFYLIKNTAIDYIKNSNYKKCPNDSMQQFDQKQLLFVSHYVGDFA